MPRILGVDLPADKPTHISLRYLYGIGPTTALELCEQGRHRPAAPGQGADRRRDRPARRPSSTASTLVEGPLRRQIAAEHRPAARTSAATAAIRHRRSLPVRGQRTQTNARTRKGPRKTVAGKKGVKEMR